jgi:hypothetical protein
VSCPNLVRQDDRNNSTRTLAESLAAELGETSLPDDLTREQLIAAESYWRRIGNHANTVRILLCWPGPGAQSDRLRHSCHLSRVCTYCTKRWAARTAERAVECASLFVCPIAVLITAPSTSLFDLAATIAGLKRFLNRLKRRKRFRQRCRAGILVFECPLTKDARRWNVHIHAILDLVPLDADADRDWRMWVEAEWAKLCGQPGARFSFEPLRDARQFVRYGLKVDGNPSYSDPTLPPRLQVAMGTALYRKRLVTIWGPTKSRAPRARGRAASHDAEGSR